MPDRLAGTTSGGSRALRAKTRVGIAGTRRQCTRRIADVGQRALDAGRSASTTPIELDARSMSTAAAATIAARAAVALQDLVTRSRRRPTPR